jgi:hypothetical protein
VLGIGAMLTDFNSGALTARGDRSESINIMQQSVRVGNAIYYNVGVRDVLGALARKLPRKDLKAPRVHGLGEPIGKPSDEITVDTFTLRPLWGSLSPRCPRARRSRIKRFGAPSGGLRRPHLALLCALLTLTGGPSW